MTDETADTIKLLADQLHDLTARYMMTEGLLAAALTEMAQLDGDPVALANRLRRRTLDRMDDEPIGPLTAAIKDHLEAALSVLERQPRRRGGIQMP